MNRRASGVLLPVYALPSPHGIGTLGRAAYDFADFLHAAGQRCWQMLPWAKRASAIPPTRAFPPSPGTRISLTLTSW